MKKDVYTSDIAFTPTVKALQASKGSRQAYARMEQRGSWESSITEELQMLIAQQSSFYMATANADGQPYIQHRGGPPGFLKVVDAQTLGFVDFSGNQQFISVGNLSENPKVHLFLMDYTRRRRIKIWGEARIVNNDPELIAKWMPENYRAKPERVILIQVKAWDVNCPQHIPVLFDAEKVKQALDAKDEQIRQLTAELERLKLGQMS